MASEFSANTVRYGFVDADSYQVVALADGVSETANRIEFRMRVRSFDPEVTKLGIETYLVVLPSGKSKHDCLDSVSITATKMTLSFDPDSASSLEIDEVMELELDLGPEDFRKLIVGLRSIVGDGFGSPDLQELI